MPLSLLARLTTPRTALLASLAIMWLNYALTSRWAHIPGSIHGPKQPFFLMALVVATVGAARTRGIGRPVRMPLISRLAFAASVAMLGAAFVSWFPPSSWTQIPFLDNWPPRYQGTIDGVRLLRRGAFVGWEWSFLGGYHSSSDISQNLALLAFLPIQLLGERPGFHLLHALLFAAVPALIYVDLRLDENQKELAVLGGALGGVIAGNYSYFLVRSGDTNSLAGAVCVLVAITGSHAARRGRAWGGPCLLLGLVLTIYSHVGFFSYAALYLLLEGLLYRDRRAIRRLLLALAVALVAGSPLTWESWRYRSYFLANNLIYRGGGAIDWPDVLAKFYYNVEILFRPGRWFNDYGGLTNVFLPVFALVAWRDRSRARFHAWAALFTVALLRFNLPPFAYVFLRPVHMLAIFAGPVLALFILRFAGTRWLALVIVLLVALYIQISFVPVPHVSSVRDFDAALVDRIRQADGALVLVENSPHRNMNATPGGETERSPFQTHFEPLLRDATGRRLYAGFWDGWQWCPWRGEVVAGGTFDGHAIGDTPPALFAREMKRWGIRRLLVWSDSTKRYLASHALFVRRWDRGPWAEFDFKAPDVRDVVTAHGAGRIVQFDPLGASIDLDGVAAGDPIIVRTHFHPSWTARVDGMPLALADSNGQIRFTAPRSGSYRVELRYPRRRGLTVFAGFVLVAGVIAVETLLRSHP
ncbi:MAG: hypothetical protein HYX76_06725 [Acidobacteria bacterium]|nr:hypothetical protein [Acidobacteriota bacterium]